MARNLSVEVQAALGDCDSAVIGVIQSVAEIASNCARGDVESATVALSHMSTSVGTAEAVFLRACKRHDVAPDDVVDALAAMRGLLQFLAECGAATRPG